MAPATRTVEPGSTTPDLTVSAALLLFPLAVRLQREKQSDPKELLDIQGWEGLNIRYLQSNILVHFI